jgi:hypothetical protein
VKFEIPAGGRQVKSRKRLRSGEILDIKFLWNLISQKGQSSLMKGQRFPVRILVKDMGAKNPIFMSPSALSIWPQFL